MATTPKPFAFAVSPKTDAGAWAVINAIGALNATVTTKKDEKTGKDKSTSRKPSGAVILEALTKAVLLNASDATIESLIADVEAARGSSTKDKDKKAVALVASLIDAKAAAQSEMAPDSIDEAQQMLEAILAKHPELKKG